MHEINAWRVLQTNLFAKCSNITNLVVGGFTIACSACLGRVFFSEIVENTKITALE